MPQTAERKWPLIYGLAFIVVTCGPFWAGVVLILRHL